MRLVIALWALIGVGCASHPTSSTQSAAMPRPLVSPATLGADRVANQVVRGAFGPRDMTLNCVVSVKGDSMSVIGMAAMGVRVFTLRYDGRTTSVDNSLPIPPQLTPERMLADFQLVYWPLASLEKVLGDAGWELTQPTPSTRRLRRDGRIVAEVHYADADAWLGRSWLVNLEHGYTLAIESQAM